MEKGYSEEGAWNLSFRMASKLLNVYSETHAPKEKNKIESGTEYKILNR